MSLDYQQIKEQVRQMGDDALRNNQRRAALLEKATGLLLNYAREGARLRQKVLEVASVNENLRCAIPAENSTVPLNASISLPPPLTQGTLLAADGSQAISDRHAEVEYGLINVGTIQLDLASAAAPIPHIQCKLMYGEEYFADGAPPVDRIQLLRDLQERCALADLIDTAPSRPVITFTDGPLELWEPRNSAAEHEYSRALSEYNQALLRLQQSDAIAAGYVERPSSPLVVQFLAVASASPEELANLRSFKPLQGLTDANLFANVLQPDQRSAVFALQSRSAYRYPGELALHFFYLHTGAGSQPIARVDIPAWVAHDPAKLDALHSALIQQCRILGGRAYPYLLHRAHEVALVSFDEKKQLTNMILTELVHRGFPPGEKSAKQSNKDTQKRTRY